MKFSFSTRKRRNSRSRWKYKLLWNIKQGKYTQRDAISVLDACNNSRSANTLPSLTRTTCDSGRRRDWKITEIEVVSEIYITQYATALKETHVITTRPLSHDPELFWNRYRISPRCVPILNYAPRWNVVILITTHV